MFKKLENFIFDNPNRSGIKYLELPDYKTAAGLRKSVLKQMRQEFQTVPPLTLHYCNEKLMAAAWTFSRETLVAGAYSRSNRELVAAITSQINICPFCVEVHTSMLYGAGDLSAIDVINDMPASNKNQYALANWARASLSPGTDILANPPLEDTDKPYLIGTVLAFHYTNRMVNIFLEDSPLPITITNIWLKRLSGKLIGIIAGRRIVSVRAEPGQSVYSDNEAPLPPAFKWATDNEPIARSIAGFAEAVERAGAQSLSANIRKTVLGIVNEWNGEEMPLSRDWIDAPLAHLSEHERPAAELALLAALASFRISESLIERFKHIQPNDIDLLSAASWGAYIAMQRISTWIAPNEAAPTSK